MTVLVPRFQKMQKEGESGRKKINQYTRYLTVIVTILQASAYVTYLQGMTQQNGAIMAGYAGFFWLSTVVVLTAGTMFVMWMGEKITDKGLGNGTSLIIMIGILARLPQSFLQELSAKSVRNGLILVFIIEIAILIAIIMGCILLIQGVRKLRQANCWKPPVWWCPPVPSPEGQQCRCNADHLCSGHHFYPDYFR
jgi:preprotein translocase subunit SecY